MHEKLGQEIQTEMEKADGTWGIYAKSLADSKIIFEHNPNETFPAASTAKIGIALYVFSLADNKEIKLDDFIVVEKDLKLGGSGVLKYLHDNLKLTILDTIKLMLILSDNSAAKMLVKKFTPQKINQFLKSLGFEVTKLTIEGDKFGFGMTTPKEISVMLEGIYKNEYLTEDLSTQLLEIMKKQQKPERIIRYLPEKLDEDFYLKVSGKSGSITGVRSDVGIVHTKNPYVLAILSKDLSDDKYRPDNKGVLAIAQISKVIFDRLSNK